MQMRLVPIGWLSGCSSFAVPGIRHDLADLAADEIRGGVVRRPREAEIVVGIHEGETTALPARRVFFAPDIVAIIERAAVGLLGENSVARDFAGEAADLGIILAERVALLAGQRGIAGGNGKIRSALKHCQMFCLFGDDGRRLNA
ncbi:hypothetical protein ACVWZZ_007137 [Bradyrhizobium sp. LM6.10]